MKKQIILLICLLSISLMMQAKPVSVTRGDKVPPVQGLEKQGWKIQHSVLAFDSLTIYFSAIQPGSKNYDLFVLRSEGDRWSNPERLDILCSEKDEWWPSVNSDEATLYFVRRTKASQADKDSYEQSQLFSSQRVNGSWEKAEPIIVSGLEDNKPEIREDNKTLVFYRRKESRNHDGPWCMFKTERMSRQDWVLPDSCRAKPKTKPIHVLTGTLVQSANGEPLTSGRVYVYDAITQQLLQTARVHDLTGRFRIALQKGEQYHIDITADGFSHHYIECNERKLKSRTVEDVGKIALSQTIHVAIQLYDSETQERLGAEQRDFTIGTIYPIDFHFDAYRDTSLIINTEKQVLFDEAEIDFPLTPKKSRHTIRVFNPHTGKPVENAEVRLNGRIATLDTALRLSQQVAMNISAAGYFFYDTIFDTGTSEQARTITIALQPIAKDQVLQLRAIRFDHDSYAITQNSDAQLKQLLHFMQINPTLRIELSAHTDDKGTDAYNDRLSSLRGNAVAEWLRTRGIDPNRIVAVGYGKRKPLVPNNSDKNRAINRRVEIKVIDY